MIKLYNIQHRYKDKSVLNGLDLLIQKNQLTCLLGGSGSGKTTILRLIAGLEIPDSGTISIDNRTVSNSGEILIPAHKRDIGFVFQDLALWPHYTVYKNIAFGLIERKTSNIQEKVSDILKFFGIQEYGNKYPHQLSGGQQQLTAIARALVLEPKILLMDEPLANLDVKLKRKILDYIKMLNSKLNLTIIYVTHDHREAFAIADEIVVINNGIIEDKGTVQQIKNSNNEYVKYFLEY